MSLFIKFAPGFLGGGGGGSTLTIGTIDSVSPSANGAVITGTELIMQSASATVPGLVNLAAQTFAGIKTFNSNPIMNALTASQLVATDGSKALTSLARGDLTDAGTDGIVVTSGTGAVIGSGTAIAQHVADSTHNGYLSSADWVAFNAKQPAGNYITALTGDGTATGPGSVALTLATVNGNVGSFSPAAITVNGKGLVTAASNVTTGNLTDAGTDGIVVTGGTGAVLGSGTTLAQHVADSTHNGYLSSTDWSTFNSKQATISIGSFDTTPNSNGLSLTGAAISLAAANGTNPGGLSAAAQAIGGVKTFAAAPVMSALTASQVVVTDGGKALASLAYATAPAASTLVEWDANKNASANNFLAGYNTTATAAGTTTLVVGDAEQQYFTGSTTQTVKLPVTSTLVTGFSYLITNLSSGVVTVQSSGANTLQAMAANTMLVATVISTSGTGTASWNWSYQAVQTSLPGGITQLTGDITAGPGSGSQATTAAATQANIVTLSKSTGVAVHGTNTNDNAAAGYVGEVISSNPGAPVTPAASTSYITITSISLTAGDWDVSGFAEMAVGGTFNGTLLRAAISLTTNATDSLSSGGYFSLNVVFNNGADTNVATGIRRISVASTTTVYLVGRLNYAVLGTTTWGVNSFLSARRVR